MTRGRFITLEGGEGSGKSTQARLLAARLAEAGVEAIVTREPGGSPVAEQIRDLILAAKPQEPVAEMLLFAAARAEHLTATIRPALARGAWVICDRFIDSTRIYQGVLGRVDMGLIKMVEAATVGPAMPDLTLVLDVAPSAGLARARSRGALNRYDAKDAAWHEALRSAFRAIADGGEPRCVLVDGEQTADQVAACIWSMVDARLGPVGR